MIKKYTALFFLFFLLLNKAFAEPQPPARKLILSVGVSHFKDKNWNPLKFASKDATSIHKKLSESGKSWSKLLVATPDGEASVSHNDFLKALNELKKNNTSAAKLPLL